MLNSAVNTQVCVKCCVRFVAQWTNWIERGLYALFSHPVLSVCACEGSCDLMLQHIPLLVTLPFFLTFAFLPSFLWFSVSSSYSLLCISLPFSIPVVSYGFQTFFSVISVHPLHFDASPHTTTKTRPIPHLSLACCLSHLFPLLCLFCPSCGFRIN